MLATTPIAQNILPGITRQFLIELVEREGISFKEMTLRVNDLFSVDELFLAGTTSEVLPVVKVDERVIGNGRPGVMSRRLLAAHQRAVAAFL
jgi:branched-subunit amino acid aminotransferase/4-amino-4-deoxychorismate lyase